MVWLSHESYTITVHKIPISFNKNIVYYKENKNVL